MIRLTPTQAEEVSGLLDVCLDDYGNGDRDNEGWGTLTWSTSVLTVTDYDEAVQDLEDRARWAEEESHQDRAREGVALARSLRNLKEKIVMEKVADRLRHPYTDSYGKKS